MYATTVIGYLYGVYVLLVSTVIGLFTRAVTVPSKVSLKFKVAISTWIAFLSVLAVVFHLVTYFHLPWVRWEFIGKSIAPDKEFTVTVKDYNFMLPENPIQIKANKLVKFNVKSEDVTYGFGVFREDGTLVFQMQVVPGHPNEIMWVFEQPGKYTVRSTEYSGPENWKMVVPEAIIVS